MKKPQPQRSEPFNFTADLSKEAPAGASFLKKSKREQPPATEPYIGLGHDGTDLPQPPATDAGEFTCQACGTKYTERPCPKCFPQRREAPTCVFCGKPPHTDGFGHTYVPRGEWPEQPPATECDHQWADYGTLKSGDNPKLEIEACIRCGVQRKKQPPATEQEWRVVKKDYGYDEIWCGDRFICKNAQATEVVPLVNAALAAGHEVGYQAAAQGNEAIEKHLRQQLLQAQAAIAEHNKRLEGIRPERGGNLTIAVDLSALDKHDAEVQAATLKQYCENEGYSFSHCAIHDTYPVPNEPCWQCINQFNEPKEGGEKNA